MSYPLLNLGLDLGGGGVHRRVSLCFNNRHTLGSYRGLNQSEIVKGGPQTFVFDVFLLFPNQKRDRAHVEEFQQAQHEITVYDRREN